MYIIYGIKVPQEIVKFYNNDLLKENNIYADKENNDLKFIPYGNLEYIVGRIIEKDNYFQLDTEELNKFTTEDFMYDFFNTYIANFLKSWVKYIETQTDILKKEGKTEEEVGKELEKLEINDSIGFNFYIISL